MYLCLLKNREDVRIYQPVSSVRINFMHAGRASNDFVNLFGLKNIFPPSDHA